MNNENIDSTLLIKCKCGHFEMINDVHSIVAHPKANTSNLTDLCDDCWQSANLARINDCWQFNTLEEHMKFNT